MMSSSGAAARNCVVCGLEVDTKKGTIIRHTPDHGCRVKSGAGHYSHALCLDPDVDIGCLACASSAVDVQALARDDPKTARDYVDFPLPETMANELRKRWLVPLVNVNRHREDISDPVALIRLGPKLSPVPWLVKEKQIGLHHILEAGAIIDDFLRAGYKIGDLQHFQDLDPLRTPALDRRQRALESLGLVAEHLRDHRDALPIAKMRADYGMVPQYIHEALGLGVHPTAGVCGWRHASSGEPGWFASDLAYLGFSYQHLLNMGLTWRSHWDKLQAVQSDLDALGASVASIEALAPEVHEPQVDAEVDDQYALEPSYVAVPTPHHSLSPPTPTGGTVSGVPAQIKRRPLPFGLKKR